MTARLRHDAAQHDQDRLAALRRGGSLDAVEPTLTLLAHIGTLPERAASPSQALTEMQPFLQASAKLWLVAQPKAAVLACQRNAQLHELLSKALPKVHDVRRSAAPVARRGAVHGAAARPAASRPSRGRCLCPDHGRDRASLTHADP